MTNTGPERTGAEENAWQLYQVTMEWVRHGDAKVTALFAANATLIAGVLAMENARDLEKWLVLPTLGLALVSLALAAWAVMPNLRPGSPSTSLVFFDHAARKHPNSSTYLAAHRSLLDDSDALVEDVAEQTWNLARVASSKFRWTGFSIVALALAAAAAAATFLLEVL